METILERYGAIVDAVTRHGSRIRRTSPTSALAQCPAHDDREPSLSIKAGDQTVLVYCYAGCHQTDVLDVLGLTWTDLWPDDGTRKLETPQAWKAYQQAVRAANEQQQQRPTPSHGADVAPVTTRRGPVAAQYVYLDQYGSAVAKKLRFPRIDIATGEVVGKSFVWQHIADDQWVNGAGNETVPIYNLPDVMSAVASGRTVWFVEGEKDADTLTAHGQIATTLPSTSSVDVEQLRPLTGATVTLIVDRDKTGTKWAADLGDALTSLGCHLTYKRATTGKDISDHLDAGHTLDQLVVWQPDGDLDNAYDLDDEEPDTTPATTWHPRLILDITNDLAKEPAPDILTRTDGKALAYRGRVNGLIGESESGKTWVALHAVTQQLQLGHNVIWIDFEDSPTGILKRLRNLNVDNDKLGKFYYVHPEETYNLAARHEVLTLVNDTRPSLIVFDGVNAAMTLLGLDINSNNDASYLFQHVLNPLTQTPDDKPGACVIYIDHVTKNKETRGKGALGAGAKRAMTSGCIIAVHVIDYPAPGQTGRLRLRVDKDRPGLVRAEAFGPKAHVGIATIESIGDNHVNIKIDYDKNDATADDQERPERITEEQRIQRIMEHRHADIEANGTRPTRGQEELVRQISGHSDTTRRLLRRLRDGGFLDKDHRWIRPYIADTPET